MTAQGRMSAMNMGCPWRGPLVRAADASFTVGNRATALFLYSDVAASTVTGSFVSTRLLLLKVG